MGAGLVKAAPWARILSLALAAVLVVVNFLTVPHYPLRPVVAIAFYAFVIRALCVVRPGDL
nr:hypothetical protein [Streptomyces sp. HB2AG]